MIRYTKEQKEFLIANNYMTPSKDLAAMFNNRFGTNITASNIKTFRGNNHLNSGLTGRFEKGHIPDNKGKTWDDYMSKDAQARSRKTTFKKGNKPLNAVDIGEESMRYSGSKPDDLGYVHVKVCDGKGNKNWVPKQRVIYEQHYGPIPKGYKVIFAEYENRKLKNEIDILENELVLIKNDKKFMAITLTFVNKINKLNKIINKIFIYNTKIIRSEKSKKIKDYALNNLKIMEGENE